MKVSAADGAIGHGCSGLATGWPCMSPPKNTPLLTTYHHFSVVIKRLLGSIRALPLEPIFGMPVLLEGMVI
jgi:hypothetical protein